MKLKYRGGSLAGNVPKLTGVLAWQIDIGFRCLLKYKFKKEPFGSEVLDLEQESARWPFGQYRHHRDVSTLQASSKTHGCKLCWILNQQIIEHGLSNRIYAPESPGILQLSRLKNPPDDPTLDYWTLSLLSQKKLITSIHILPSRNSGLEELPSVASHAQQTSNTKSESTLW